MSAFPRDLFDDAAAGIGDDENPRGLDSFELAELAAIGDDDSGDDEILSVEDLAILFGTAE